MRIATDLHGRFFKSAVDQMQQNVALGDKHRIKKLCALSSIVSFNLPLLKSMRRIFSSFIVIFNADPIVATLLVAPNRVNSFACVVILCIGRLSLSSFLI